MALMPAPLACFCAASPFPAFGQLEQWTLERAVMIGDALDPEKGLTLVGDVIAEGDRLLVAQPLEQRVRVYSVTGDFLRFIGRGGEGPGEFRRVDGMGLHDGRVWIHDSSSRRLQYFDAEGGLVSSVQFRGHPTLRASGEVWGVLADESKLVMYSASAHEFGESPLKPEGLLRFGAEGLAPDTVAIIVGRSSVVQLSDGRESGWKSYSTLPESYRSLLSVTPDGSGFVVVHRTGATSVEPHTFRVIRFDARADTAWARDVSYDPIRVPSAWRSRHMEEDIRDYEVPGVSESSIRHALKRAYGRLEFFPPVGDVQAGADGTTWLLVRTGVDSSVWEVLDESGLPLARVDQPPRGSIMWAGAESLWFFERGEFDVPYLVRYVIRRP